VRSVFVVPCSAWFQVRQIVAAIFHKRWIANGKPLLPISALILLWILPCRKFIGPSSACACMNSRSCSAGTNSSVGRAPSASKHEFIMVHHHCARSWLFLDSAFLIDLSVSWRVIFALVELQKNTCSKFSSALHMGHFGLELKYLCILVAVAHSLLMNFKTGISLAKFSWLIESASRSHVTVASFALIIPMCFSRNSLYSSLWGVWNTISGMWPYIWRSYSIRRMLLWDSPWS